MAVEKILAQNWQKLLELREEHLGYMLSTQAADREKLEHAISNIYELASLEQPKQIIWFDSPIDTMLSVALWYWLLDPDVHAFNFAGNDPTESDFLAGISQFLMSGNEELQSEFPTLYTTSDEPVLLRSQEFEDLFRTFLDPEQSHADLRFVLSTSVLVTSNDPVRIALPEGRAFKRLLNCIEDPQGFEDRTLKQSLEEGLKGRHAGFEQDLFGPAVSMNLRSKMMAPVREELNRIIDNGMVDRILEPYDRVKNILQFNRHDWQQAGSRISAISDSGNCEFRSWLTRILSRLSALNAARSSMADTLPVAIHRALDLLGVKPMGQAQALLDAVKAGGWWWPFNDICFACDNPAELHVDDSFEPHKEGGMAVRYRDGWGFWALNGLVLPEAVVLNQYSAADIDAVSLDRFMTRDLMIRRFGLSKYLQEGRAEEIHRDDYGILYRKACPGGRSIGIVVTDQTSDSDFNQYAILVPAEISSATEAVSWMLKQSKILESTKRPS